MAKEEILDVLNLSEAEKLDWIRNNKDKYYIYISHMLAELAKIRENQIANETADPTGS